MTDAWMLKIEAKRENKVGVPLESQWTYEFARRQPLARWPSRRSGFLGLPDARFR
jgi:hypothetical protein